MVACYQTSPARICSAAMLSGELWCRLRDLLDTAEDSGALPFSLDAHAVKSGSTRALCEVGEQVLRRAVAEQAEHRGARFSRRRPGAGVTTLLPLDDQALGRLFDALGLDGRLRKHPRPLEAWAKAETVRALVGEAHRASEQEAGRVHPRGGRGWRCGASLVEDLAGGLVELHSGVALQDPHYAWLGTPEYYYAPDCGYPYALARPDAILVSHLRGGSASAIASRLCELCKAQPLGPRELHDTLGSELPALSTMRLLVFVQALHSLCRPSASTCLRVRGYPATRSSVASAVVAAVAAARLASLPFETSEQLADFRSSPFMAEQDRSDLLDLLVPADGALDQPLELFGWGHEEVQRERALREEVGQPVWSSAARALREEVGRPVWPSAACEEDCEHETVQVAALRFRDMVNAAERGGFRGWSRSLTPRRRWIPPRWRAG